MISDKIIAFKKSLPTKMNLTDAVEVMNPYGEGSAGLKATTAFYKKYFNDNNTRQIIFNNSPSRLGAGHTGIELTDTKNLEAYCSITFDGSSTYEISSVFFYHMIEEYGDVAKFYDHFYVGAISPICLTQMSAHHNVVNAVYYETPQLEKELTPYIEQWIPAQLEFNIDTEVAYILGASKNLDFITKLNDKHHWFKKLVSLEHPRYIQEYKQKELQTYIDKYLAVFKENAIKK